MAHNQIITGIDLGTDKCTTVIAMRDAELGQLRVMGVSAISARGIKKGQIIDLEQVLSVLTESLDAAERMAGIEVKRAFVSVSGSHLSSQNSKGVVAVASPDQEIVASDLARVIEAARAVSLPSDREIIHIIPKHYSVDSQEGIKDPIGMTGVRLETEAHLITGLSSTLRNIEKCVSDLGVTIEAFVFAGLASAEVVLSETEKELGVVLVDIGAGSTSLCVYVEGALEHSASLPIGAHLITKDIALGCQVSIDVAEKIKLYFSHHQLEPVTPLAGESKQDFNKRRKSQDQLWLKELGLGETDEVLSKKHVVEGIMVPRLEELMSMIGEYLEKKKLFTLVPAGLVLTGGGAQTILMTEVAKHTLKLPARLGIPVELQGLTGDLHAPSYATVIGLLEYGRALSAESRSAGLALPSFAWSEWAQWPKKAWQLLRSILP